MTANSTMACLLGSSDSWDMIRPIGQAGIRCALFAEPDDPVRVSRFATVALDRADPTGTPDILLERLQAFSRAQHETPVLYYATDADLLFVSRYRDQLSSDFRFVIASDDHVEKLLNKDLFRLLAEQMNLPVPASQTISPRAEAPSAMILSFPIIMKPSEREILRDDRAVSVREQIGKHVKCFGVETRDELEKLWPTLEAINADFIAQEMIPGPESRIESYHAYIDAGGNIVAHFTGRKIRTYRAEFGNSTALETTDAPDVNQLGEDLVGQLGITGIVKFDFKRRPDGTLGLLEINPRFSLWQHLGAKAGVNFNSLVYKNLTNQPRGPVVKAKAGVFYCRLSDFRAAREQKISMLEWVPWMLKAEAKEVALDDLMPLLKRIQMKVSRQFGGA